MSNEVDILVNGKPIKKYYHNHRWFVEAKDGAEYTIRIRNNSISTRKLAVCAVDGINVIDGTAAGSSDAGYIINAYGAYHIKGFRTSNDSVNAFKFTKKDKSYAAKSEETQGDVTNCGVIGVRVYSEKKPLPPPPIIIKEIIREREVEKPPKWPNNPWETPWTWPNRPTIWCSTSNNVGPMGDVGPLGPKGVAGEQSRCLNANFLSVVGGPQFSSNVTSQYIVTSSVEDDTPQGFDLGTEFSNKAVEDKVVEASFEIDGTIPSETIEIYYASRKALISMGVIKESVNEIAFPQAFPSKFCKPPRK